MSSKKLPIIAIVGRANVGKSSLFNAILERREAIVTREAGTTRDSITAKADYRGHQFWLVDTAGVKTPEDDFELTIQEQIDQAVDSADIIWVVTEADTVITDQDRIVAKKALKSKKPVVLVVNKIDQVKNKDVSSFKRLGIKPVIATSTTQNFGIEELLDDLIGKIPKIELKTTTDLSIAIVGRPNVGKSALFNSLAKKQQAIVSDRAGTTRDINRIGIKYESKNINILDTAGIRRSGKIEVGIEKFSILRTLSAVEEADIVLLVLDVNELGTKLDQSIAGLIKEAGRGLVLVISKWDSYEDKDPFSRDNLAAKLKYDFDFVPWAPLIFTSSITGQNVIKIFELALEIDKRRSQTFKTAALNKWLRDVTLKHPPAGLKNRNPKLNYMVHEEGNPIPSFKIFGAHTKFLHWSYKRYMEKQFREIYDFSGTPVKFWFIEKH